MEVNVSKTKFTKFGFNSFDFRISNKIPIELTVAKCSFAATKRLTKLSILKSGNTYRRKIKLETETTYSYNAAK
jgi:hypothetical protein